MQLATFPSLPEIDIQFDDSLAKLTFLKCKISSIKKKNKNLIND